MTTRNLLLAVLALGLVVGLNAAPLAKIPTFSEYPVTNIYHGRIAALDLTSHPNARYFRTRLREAAESRKPDFAGHYIVAKWGCGTICESFALIDARNGKVYFPDFTPALGTTHHLNSRLLVVDGPEDLAAYNKSKSYNPPLFSSWYLWDEKNKTFKLLRSDDPQTPPKKRP